jgi:hypothetical protein
MRMASSLFPSPRLRVAAGLVALLAYAPLAARAEHKLAPVSPLREPIQLSLAGAPEFRFAAEVINAGIGRPDLPRRILIAGTGSANRGLMGTTVWKLVVLQANLDGQAIGGSAPLAVVTVEIGGTRPNSVTEHSDFRGLNALVGGAAATPAMAMLRSVVAAAALGVYAPPAQPLAQNMPVLNVTLPVDRYVRRSLRDARVVQPVPPATVTGVMLYNGRRAVELQLAGSYAIQYGYATVALRADGVAAIDTATGLPLFTQFRSHGPVQLAVAQGLVDYTMRSAIALPDMPDPVTLLAPPQPPAPEPSPAITPPPKAPKASVAKPAASAPAEPRPKPAPAKPPAAADDAGKRLEQLKSLFDRGLITKDQYEAKQKEILGAL